MYKPFKFVPPLKEEEVNESYSPFVILNKFFSPDEVAAIELLWNEDIAQQGTVAANSKDKTGGKLDLERRSAKEMFIDADNTEWLYDKIEKACMMVNATVFKLDIRGFKGKMRFLKYGEGDFFDWHMDYGRSKISDRKLVVCIQLSGEDEYEGGDLQLITDKFSVPREKGTAAVFPSYLLHRVTRITSGCRKSLIALIGGPPFK